MINSIFSRAKQPRKALRFRYRAEGSEVLPSGRKRGFTATFWQKWDKRSSKWIVWERREYDHPVEPATAVAGVPDDEPDPALLMALCMVFYQHSRCKHLQFVSDDGSPLDQKMEKRVTTCQETLTTWEI